MHGADESGAGLSNPVLRFRRRNGSGKKPDGQGTDLGRGLLFIIEHGIIFPAQTDISKLIGMKGVTTNETNK